tara:strand:+ start:528 stop:2996 length:2469 start_codon:yes stop_codon:yes gene_type:complete
MLRYIFIFWSLICICGFSQEVIILDSEQNPISNVAVFNASKTKSALSDNHGIINLSRFLENEKILFQHPSYLILEIEKSEIKSTVTLNTNFNFLPSLDLKVSKNDHNIKNVAEKKIFISSKEIKELGSITTADLLEKKGGISVQKSQMGGGSPNIRGFEANRVLLVLDGVRLNNAIYRSAHLQNLITIDEYLIDDIEVIFGPSSVLYGSDALGGTINMKSKSVQFKAQAEWNGGVYSSYSTAYDGFKTNVFSTYESSKYSAITSISMKKFGDIKMGLWRPHGYENWGLVHHYINEDGELSCNEDLNVQKNTGYSQYDLFHKLIVKISDNWRATWNTQYSTSSNVPRFDRLNDGDLECIIDPDTGCNAIGNLKYHTYYYGPQDRRFNSLKFTGIETGSLDKTEIILSNQLIKESRHKLKLSDFFNNPEAQNDETTRKYERVDIYSVNINFKKNNFYFGSETVYNEVKSTSNIFDPEDKWSIGDTRYPPGGSSIFSHALYINSVWRFSHKFQSEIGGRYTYSHIKGAFPDTLKRPFAYVEGLNLNEQSNILSGNIKFVYYPSDSWKISSVTARGFHTPNVDDMLKVFEKGNRLVIPNVYLQPEYSISQELSISKDIGQNIDIYGVGFYTRIKNAMVMDSIGIVQGIFNGEPLIQYSYLYEDEMKFLFANQNSTSPTDIFGGTFGFNTNIKNFILSGDINFTKGVNRGSGMGPVAHIPPVFGKVELMRKINNWKLKCLFLYAGSKPANEFDEANVDNLYETPNVSGVWMGSPKWNTVNLSVNYKLSESFELQINIDNILDRHYKTFSSGLSAPGRNFIFSTTILF